MNTDEIRTWIKNNEPPFMLECERCGKPKVAGRFCEGNDAPCEQGPNGATVLCCAGWGFRCCRCGSRWAIDQI